MWTRTPSLDSYTSHSSFAAGASRAHEAGTRSRLHLKRALAEIDGLFAGLNYLDNVEPCQAGSPEASNQTPASASLDDLQLELNSLSPEPTAPPSTQTTTPPVPQGHDWSAIRNVRDGMERAWNEFDKLATELDICVVNNIREQYQDAKGLRETGVFAFRSTLTGPAPNNLEKIFAFTSLSYVVSSLLCSRGRLESSDVLDGIQIWFNAIKDLEERDAFLQVAGRLWPEASKHLHMIPSSMSDKGRMMFEAIRSPDRLSNPLHHDVEECNNAGVDDLSNVPLQETFDAAPIPSTEMDDTLGSHTACTIGTEALKNNVYRVIEKTAEDIDLSKYLNDPWEPPDECEDDALIFTGVPNTDSMLPIDTGQSSCGINSMVPTEQSSTAIGGASKETKPSIEDLRETKVFQVILRFLDQLNSLLYNLSGGGMTCLKSVQELLAYHEKYGMKARIYKDLLTRLLEDTELRDQRYRAIVSMTERFVNLGYLQEVEKVQTYLFFIGEKMIDDSSYKQFFGWIQDSKGKRSSTVSSTLPPTSTNAGIVKKAAPARKFYCPNCRKEFPKKWNMERHQRLVHNTSPQNSGLTPKAARSHCKF